MTPDASAPSCAQPPGEPPEQAPAIERATGRSWSGWAVLLEQGGAREKSHAGIASVALEAMPATVSNPGWWAQSVAVAYERWAGRRVKGQAHDGTFQVSVSRTLPGSTDEVFAMWCSCTGHRDGIGGVALAEDPRESGTPGRRHWRVGLTDGTRTAVSVESRVDGRAVLTATHSKLATAEEVERRRAVWKKLLATL